MSKMIVELFTNFICASSGVPKFDFLLEFNEILQIF